ncbi:hypothetical protein ABFX02_08G131600 [Erythranthe guttata]
MTRAVRDRILKDVNGNISDHLRNHIHLTNCIHLKNHMHKHSPMFADRALMRDLVTLQRSRSLRDPSASPPSWHSPSTVDLLLKRGEKGDLVNGRRSVEDASRNSQVGHRHDRHLKTLSDQLKDAPFESDGAASSRNTRQSQVQKNGEEAGASIRHRSSVNNRAKRRRFRGARRTRPSMAAQNEISVASNSFAQAHKHKVEEGINGVPGNGCGIPWNWSSLHNRGKSILDMAGRSLSCGLSESGLKRGGSNSRGINTQNIPVMSENSSSSTKSNHGEALPLLLDASEGSIERARWFHDYSGELGVFADNLLKQETDSDLASEGRSHEQQHQHKHRKQHQERHQSITQKHLPRTFRDLVGQNLVVQALSNAIAKRKIGLLYLFHGPHGTGKTSCARIFSRALNCQSIDHPKPCGFCSSCIKNRNVREIGPVSNIDFRNIIELLDNAVASQLQSQYRVFIFDECDTLSTECWSAILKVIDRAPRRVVFVLVCSSIDALPHVIISRCQKFLFPKLKDADIIYTLQWIATKEDLDIDKDALKLIASRSDGSLRDAEMTLEQLSLLGKRISIGLVQELVGLISDEKLVDLLDLALSADTVNTVKNLRDIMESGVEPLALMSQLATVITDILAGSYIFVKESSRRKFFRRSSLSKEDMEKLRQALKILSEAEKQLRVSNDRMTWLTAALLQLAPDQQYMVPNSSADTSFNHSPLVLNNDAHLREKPRKSSAEMPAFRNVHYDDAKLKGSGGNFEKENPKLNEEIDEIWMQVLEKIPINGVKEFLYQEAKLVSVSYGAAPTVQLLFNSQLTKSKAEKFRLQILQAFESVLRSRVTIEIRCESRKDIGAADPTKHEEIRSFRNRDASSSGINRREIVEIEASPRDYKDRQNVENAPGVTSMQKKPNTLGDRNQSLSLVRSKVSLAHVIQQAEGCSQHNGWSKRKAVSIAEKLEQENLRLESRSRKLLCWNPPKVTCRKLSRFKIRARKPQTLLKYVSCGRCLSSKSPR